MSEKEKPTPTIENVVHDVPPDTVVELPVDLSTNGTGEVAELPIQTATVIVKEPMIHQVGRMGLGFVMTVFAEKLANITYDQCLKLYRSRKKI